MDLIFKKIFLVTLVLSMVVNISDAQYTYTLSKYEIGVQVGGLISRTSLTVDNPLGAYKQMHPSVSVFAQAPLIGPLDIRTSLMFGQIGYDDSKVNDPRYSWLKLRNFKYTTTMAELSTVVVWNLAKERYNLFTHEHKNKFTPYLFLGIGFSYVNVNRHWQSLDTAYFSNSPYVTGLFLDTASSNLPKVITVFPMGGGLRYAVDPQIAISFEFNFRYNFQNYLDGFNYSTGRSNSKDFFYGISLGVSYRPFANDFRNECPKSVL